MVRPLAKSKFPISETKDLEGSLVALQTTESKNQALEKELESIRVQRQEDCHYIRSQEDEKRSLTAERDDQRC